MAAAQLHASVYVGGAREMLLTTPDGIQKKRHQQAVDDEARSVRREHRCLAHSSNEVLEGFNGIGGAEHRADDLHQRHGGHWVEEMQASCERLAIGPQRSDQLGDGYGGGVGAKQRGGRKDTIQLREGF